jgi:hypothetical protein
MKKILFALLCTCFIGFSAVAQEEETTPAVTTDNRPVRAAWESGILINHQTSLIAPAKTLEMLIQHRFGTVANGKDDVWGIMAPGANIRLGFNYSLFDNIMAGYGLNGQGGRLVHDFQAKYTPLVQTRSNSIPVFVTLYGNMAIDGRADEAFGLNYEFGNRLSYFSELIVGRKVNDQFSMQVSANFSHYNSTALNLDHDRIGVGMAAKYKFSPQSSLQIEWGLPLMIQEISEQYEVPSAKYHFSIGYEASTSTHAFQIFISNTIGMVPQEIYMNNQSLFDKNGIRFGFNITRLWSF